MSATTLQTLNTDLEAYMYRHMLLPCRALSMRQGIPAKPYRRLLCLWAGLLVSLCGCDGTVSRRGDPVDSDPEYREIFGWQSEHERPHCRCRSRYYWHCRCRPFRVAPDGGVAPPVSSGPDLSVAGDATGPDEGDGTAAPPPEPPSNPPKLDAGLPQNTHQAQSCATADVQNAISAASHGDRIVVPAGSCSWSGLSVNKAIHLQGAGVGLTTINLSGSNTITKQSAGVLRLSGFSFSRNGGGGKGFVVSGSWKNAEPVVIEKNSFKVSGASLFLIAVAGGVVIAENQFEGGWDDSLLQMKDSNDSGGSWSTADTLGTRDTNGRLNHYVEDNTFYGGTNQGIDADDSMRVVYRHNNLTYSSFNSHGWATSPVGVRHFEVYNNTFNHSGGTSEIANQNWAIWIRGGTGVIFGNYFDDLAGSYWGQKSEVRLTLRGAEDARPLGSCASTSYPVPHQIGQSHDGNGYVTDPLYIWGNTGTVGIYAGWNWGNPCGFNFDDFFVWGRDAVKSGAQKPGYTPYTYPHPLRQ